eukprot:GHVU01088519.1.p3 GENE.GHVU01088519.1~~GHVU01088519.1.p3  ORF type:complete len:109 (+),score=15.18 GHVU01088519.1:38-364(+)
MCACVSVCVCLCVCVCECVCVYLPLGVEDENVDLADAVLPENPREASLAPGGGSGRPDTTQAGEQRERLQAGRQAGVRVEQTDRPTGAQTHTHTHAHTTVNECFHLRR